MFAGTDPGAVPNQGAHHGGVVDLPFDPVLAVGPVRIAWHSLWSLVGMGAGSWVSFRLARRLVKDERIHRRVLSACPQVRRLWLPVGSVE